MEVPVNNDNLNYMRNKNNDLLTTSSLQVDYKWSSLIVLIIKKQDLYALVD